MKKNIMNLKQRPRRLRKNEVIRSLVKETVLIPSQFIAPIFIHDGSESEIKINSMPGVYQYSMDRALSHVEELLSNDVKSVILFGVPSNKDTQATSAWEESGIIQTANKKIKERFPEVMLVNDTCLCEYMSHGHCGIILESDVLNDPTLEILQKTAVSQAASGADIIAPSGMMDGMVSAIRNALDENGYQDVAIMSYAVKYASSFYGPFREAADSAPSFGDRKSYQMDPANKREALKEAMIDEEEGADIIMVKPAMPYLDIITQVKEKTNLPIAAYNVSGEYSMIKAAGGKGWIDEERAALEMLTGIKRAGADIIISYFAKDIANLLNTIK